MEGSEIEVGQATDMRGRTAGSKATQFGAGGKRPERPPEPAIPEPESEVLDGASAILKAMRWAVRNDGVRCKGSALEETQRKAYRTNPVKFTETLAKFEALQVRQNPASVKRGAAARDEGHERVEELLRECLRRWNGLEGDGDS